jgi:hypothetical protein
MFRIVSNNLPVHSPFFSFPKIDFKYLSFIFKVFTFLFMICIISFINGCSNDNIISEDKFVKIYSDLIIAQDTISSRAKNNQELRKEILNRYNVTDDQYKATVDFYNKNPNHWEEFFTKVTAYINELKKNSI